MSSTTDWISARMTLANVQADVAIVPHRRNLRRLAAKVKQSREN
jgi:hypothetical protein